MMDLSAILLIYGVVLGVGRQAKRIFSVKYRKTFGIYLLVQLEKTHAWLIIRSESRYVGKFVLFRVHYNFVFGDEAQVVDLVSDFTWEF